jgi:hypothetical protein
MKLRVTTSSLMVLAALVAVNMAQFVRYLNAYQADGGGLEVDREVSSVFAVDEVF